MSREEKVPKLQSYKKAAEEYELEIQWGKTFIMRRNIKKEEVGKVAGLPAPFGQIKQTKIEKILGLQMNINGELNTMMKDRLPKEVKAWAMGRKFFLNTKFNKKRARIQLFHGCIKPILQYGITSQKISDVNIKKNTA